MCTVGIVWIEVDKRHRIVAGPDMQHQTTATHPKCHRVLGHPEAQGVTFAGGCYILNRIVPISLIEGIRIITGSSTEEIAAGSTDKRIVAHPSIKQVIPAGGIKKIVTGAGPKGIVVISPLDKTIRQR